MNRKAMAVYAVFSLSVCAGIWTAVGGGKSIATQYLPSGCAQPTRDDHYVGLSVPGFPPTVSNLKALEAKFQVQPSAVSMYIPLGMKLDMSAVTAVCAQGALPIIEIDSDTIPLGKVAAGDFDLVLRGYASDIKRLGVPVAIDFDHEFNAGFSAWGYGHQSAKNFIATWRRMVSLFRSAGVTNVIWIWNPATDGVGTAQLSDWYPGNSYVTWTGLDGYFTTPESTFQAVFSPTIANLKTFTNKPIFIDETGANPTSQRVRAINSLFAGVESTPNIMGLVWFDYGKTPGHDWQIENDPPALAAFRAGATAYSNS